MKKITFIIIAIILFNFGFSQDKYDAVYLKLIKEYKLNSDGSFDFNYNKKLQILTHFAFHRLQGETFIVYNPDYQKLKINDSYTIMADGKKVITPDNAYNEVLPRYADDAPAFNNLREMVVTHTGLEVNAVINLDYSLHTNNKFYPNFMGEEVITENAPVKEEIIRIIVPSDKELNYKTFNIRTAPEITKDDEYITYTWNFSNIPARSHSSHQPDYYEPGIIFSAGRDLHRVFDKFCNQEGFYFNLNLAMKEKVKELAEGVEDEIDLMIKLQDFVVNDFSTYNVPLWVSGFRTRVPAEVWNSNGGTKIEKTLLLTSLLREANINAIPVAVIPETFYDSELGSLFIFKDFLIQVNPENNKRFYISATECKDHNLLYNLGNKTLLQLDAAIESLRTISEKEKISEIQLVSGFVIKNQEKIDGTADLELNRAANPYLKLVRDSSSYKQLFTNTISSSAIKSMDIEKISEEKSKIKYEFELSDPFDKRSGYYFLDIPFINQGIESWHLERLATERSVPLEIDFPVNEQYNYTFVSPPELEFINPDKKIEIENEAGKLLIELKKSGGELIINRGITIPNKIIRVNQYKAFRELMINWFDPNYRKVILKEE